MQCHLLVLAGQQFLNPDRLSLKPLTLSVANALLANPVHIRRVRLPANHGIPWFCPTLPHALAWSLSFSSVRNSLLQRLCHSETFLCPQATAKQSTRIGNTSAPGLWTFCILELASKHPRPLDLARLICYSPVHSTAHSSTQTDQADKPACCIVSKSASSRHR